VAKKKLYEAMFLVDSGEAGSDWDGVIAAIKKILERAKVEIVSMRKWDDRRLAYDIKGKARGTYILCYFEADGQKNQDIEKGVQLSEKLVRVLILSVDWMTAEDIEQDTPATKVEKQKEKRQAAEDAAQEAKETHPDAEHEAQGAEEGEVAEESEIAQEAEVAKEPETAKEADVAEEPEIAEEAEQAEEEAEDSQESQPKTAADD
jgi:small subunit ribosomal protein S6